ncbi:hypothetical protein AB0M43_14560 [Longispora sp. NPDC051575]|uniref:hypothetical protein n=1 Tax=Longispora sp. NPDC051575 TaxID=3154943 RepID=UPI0034151AA2
MIDTPDDGWSFATAREPARFGACGVNGVPGVDHGTDVRGTLCGIPERHTTAFLHQFDPEALHSCRRCRQKAEDAPSQPCTQERLHDRLLHATQSVVRDELLTALRQGATVHLWIHGPSANLAKFYAKLETLTDGAGPAAEVFASTATVALANVEDNLWRFLVVLPEDGAAPVVARGPRDPH